MVEDQAPLDSEGVSARSEPVNDRCQRLLPISGSRAVRGGAERHLCIPNALRRLVLAELVGHAPKVLGVDKTRARAAPFWTKKSAKSATAHRLPPRPAG